MKYLNTFGPGMLVAAAFIGPGTVTTASVAGAHFGLALVWALMFSIVATCVLQDMSARLGLVSGQGLGEALRTTFRGRAVRRLAMILVVAAIGIGNAAFQTGNLTGASLGLEVLVPGASQQAGVLIVGIAAAGLLATGSYRLIERALVLLVVLMSVGFLLTALSVRPNILAILSATFQPRLPAGSLITVVALVGTTVVPYNLFLHASIVRQKWPDSVPLATSLPQSRCDTIFSVVLGGLVTLAIMTTAATAYHLQGLTVESAADMARQLEPLLGPAARYFFAIGLLAAGLTSAITAPLAAAYAICGACGWDPSPRSGRSRIVWLTVLVAGMFFGMLGYRPVAAILFAQAANGVLLPIVATFLLIVMNRRDLLGQHCNGLLANVLGTLVVLTAAGLGLVQIVKVIKAVF